jgi:hypothetical protein
MRAPGKDFEDEVAGLLSAAGYNVIHDIRIAGAQIDLIAQAFHFGKCELRVADPRLMKFQWLDDEPGQRMLLLRPSRPALPSCEASHGRIAPTGSFCKDSLMMMPVPWKHSL